MVEDERGCSRPVDTDGSLEPGTAAACSPGTALDWRRNGGGFQTGDGGGLEARERRLADWRQRWRFGSRPATTGARRIPSPAARALASFLLQPRVMGRKRAERETRTTNQSRFRALVGKIFGSEFYFTPILGQNQATNQDLSYIWDFL